jgi:hypothetical protein
VSSANAIANELTTDDSVLLSGIRPHQGPASEERQAAVKAAAEAAVEAEEAAEAAGGNGSGSRTKLV